MSALKDEIYERIDPPRYVAFRKLSGSSTLAVIASLEARDTVGHQLGRWFSELTPMETFATCLSMLRTMGSTKASQRT